MFRADTSPFDAMKPLLLSLLAALAALIPAAAQDSRLRPVSYLVPQARPWNRPPQPDAVRVTAAEARVEIAGPIATTTLWFTLTNPGPARLEAELGIPVPDGAILRGFGFQGSATGPTATLLGREEARKEYDATVARLKDPALLEFAGCGLVRSSVFPVDPHGGQRVRVVFEQLLESDGARLDYVLPRSESLDCEIPWTLDVTIRDTQPVSTVYSPSHRTEVRRLDGKAFSVRLHPEQRSEPGPFRLSWLRETSEVTASLLAYPDLKNGGGYFLLFAGTPVRQAEAEEHQKREVILVLDRSGSMSGEKLEQARAAALQLLEGLEEGEAFNVILFAESVETFAAAPVIKSASTMRSVRSFLRSVGTRGGTNIHDALAEALRSAPTPGMIPLVLFLTDGLPTGGNTSEKAIRELATHSNPHERRLFTFGVGTDVNTALLDRLASSTRGTAAFVLPGENVESKVAATFARLRGPVLASPRLRTSPDSGPRVSDLLPNPLPDLFEGDQLVVLGRYRGNAPLEFDLDGRYLGKMRTFHFRLPLEKASVKNAFIARLWAGREIARLDDVLRDLGADGNGGASDPRSKEFIDEIVRLSREFGILTQYTSFLAKEGTDLSPSAVNAQAVRNYAAPSLLQRYGLSSVSQEVNRGGMRSQGYLNRRNAQFDASMNRVEVSTVQQGSGGAYYRQNGRWVEAAAAAGEAGKPDRTVEVGSEEFRRLADRLTSEGRSGVFAMRGELVLRIGGETVLVK